MGSVPLHIKLDRVNGLIEIYDGIRYLVLSDHTWCDEIYDSIKYLISKKGDITDNINHSFARVKFDS